MASAASAMFRTTGDFVRLLFSALEREGIRYCVLHGWEELPEKVSSDLDLVVHPEDFPKLQVVFSELASADYKCIQCRHYAARSYRFDFAWFDGKHLHVVGVDCISEYRYAGLILRSGEDLLTGRRQHNGFWIAGPDKVFAYLLIKKTLKAAISPEQLGELQEMVAELGRERSLNIASEVFGEGAGAQVIAAIAARRLPEVLPQLRARLRRTVLKRDPWSYFRSHLDEQWRMVRRWFQPTGLFLIALGPDGVGKSTVLARVVENLKPAFREIYFYHYRARFGRQPTTPVTDPHAVAPRGRLLSIARVLLLFCQFWVGYLVVRPKLARSGLVIFDRYFHDLLVDHWRYRYSGPKWLVSLLVRYIPAKDPLLLVLDADERVMYSRKQDISVERLRVLRQGYQGLVANSSSAVLIRTDQPLEDTLAAVTKAAYQHLQSRCCIRYPEWIKTKGTETSAASDAVLLKKVG
jgi:thymidylate kinase